MTKDIRDRLAAQPFLAFVVHTADGRKYDVPTHDHAHVSPGGGRASFGLTTRRSTSCLRCLLVA
jgi:hypothetical protein